MSMLDFNFAESNEPIYLFSRKDDSGEAVFTAYGYGVMSGEERAEFETMLGADYQMWPVEGSRVLFAVVDGADEFSVFTLDGCDHAHMTLQGCVVEERPVEGAVEFMREMVSANNLINRMAETLGSSFGESVLTLINDAVEIDSL